MAEVEAEVVEVEVVSAWFASTEDEAVFAERARGVGAESDDAMFPRTGGIVWAGAVRLLTAMLIDPDALLEEERSGLVVVA